MTPQPIAEVKFDDNQIPYIDLGNAKIRMEREEPNAFGIEKARIELRETPEVVEKAIKELRQLIQNQPDLNLSTEDDHLKMFLRPCHWYPESAMQRLTRFYHMKLKYPEACCDVVPSKVKNAFDEGIYSLLPHRDQHGRRILVLEAGKKWKPSKVPVVEMFKGIQMTVLGSMGEPMSQICGAVVIIDVESLPLGHVMQFTPSFAAMLLEYIQDCILMRLKAVHIVNNSYIFNMLFAIFKPFIREKLRKRIFFHCKDWKSLTSHIDKDVLPVKYGGTMNVELPSGPVLHQFFESYRKDYELADTYGFKDGYKIKK